MKKLNRWNWAALLSLPVLWLMLREEEAEEYAINYFEEEIIQNSTAFN